MSKLLFVAILCLYLAKCSPATAKPLDAPITEDQQGHEEDGLQVLCQPREQQDLVQNEECEKIFARIMRGTETIDTANLKPAFCEMLKDYEDLLRIYRWTAVLQQTKRTSYNESIKRIIFDIEVFCAIYIAISVVALAIIQRRKAQK